MKGKFLLSVALAIGASNFSLPLFAHHGNAAYEMDKSVTIKGTVTQYRLGQSPLHTSVQCSG